MRFARLMKPALALALILVPTFAIAGPTRPSRDFGGEEAMERLRAADTNKDGAITRQELLAHRVKEWPRLDRNGDGFFSKDDLPGFAKDRWDNGRLVTMRQTYDTNRDGRISRTEFTSGPTPAYDLADSNRDNRVTEAEIKAAIAGLKRN
ncbi:Ca2+-binding EF-hand superfamily protein [Novosphingobium hassiacum]|uniref:Ca2+-binding EF-hand superfamily protein n=2 Tax=Novosphingobium hassiacum TaxID=173676 RepID=A0A7W5ZU72_9SPHN|nr:Ca2+-binding EF-hand superfamily protein [Novosphingobium hassiacum]